MKPIFARIWQLRGHELRQWCFYNLLLGLSPVVISWLCLAFIGVSKFKEPFLDGSLMIFTATLSAASLGFYAEGAQSPLPQTGRVVLCGLITSLILSTAGFGALVMIKELSSKTLSSNAVIISSLAILLIAIWFNLNLAAIRLVSGDAELKAKLGEESRKVAEQAKKADKVDGVDL